MATHFSILAWRIPWTEKSDGLPWGHKESDMTEATERAHTQLGILLLFHIEAVKQLVLCVKTRCLNLINSFRVNYF